MPSQVAFWAGQKASTGCRTTTVVIAALTRLEGCWCTARTDSRHSPHGGPLERVARKRPDHAQAVVRLAVRFTLGDTDLGQALEALQQAPFGGQARAMRPWRSRAVARLIIT